MNKYPKIETVWNRDNKTGKVVPGAYRLPHFKVINQWRITEKIDGTNIQVGLKFDNDVPSLDIRGRTDKAQIPAQLLSWLQENIDEEDMWVMFSDPDGSPFPEVTLYGEGYGAGIQKGGVYCEEQKFILFDAKVGTWWLRWADVEDVAQQLGLETVGYAVTNANGIPMNRADLGDWVNQINVLHSDIERVEGIVVRSDPMMFSRRGDRVACKIKFKDFS